jgi:hypothetical protein
MEIKLATVRAAYSDRNEFGRFRTERAINSDDFTIDQVRIFRKETKSLNRFLIRWILLSKVGYAMVVGYDGA